MNSIVKKILIPFVLFISMFNIFILKTKAFELSSPTVNFFQTSSELETILNSSMTKNPTLSYGSATYNYINNKFIKNELYKEYGKYYLCLGSGSSYTSHCYISDDPNVFSLNYSYSGQVNNPVSTYLYAIINKSLSSQVYDFSISSGSKSSSSGYKAASSITNSLELSNGSNYLKTNIKYFNLVGSQATHYTYNSIKTSDNYGFNIGEIMFYLENDTYKFNYEHKASEDFADITLNITLEDFSLMGDYYISKTYKLNFNKFDLNKYKYYYTFDPENIDEQIDRLLAYEIDKNDFRLTFETNTTFYVIVKNQNNKTVLLNSYEVNDIMRSRYDESLDVLDKHPDLPSDVSENIEITDDFTISDLIGWFKSLINKRLPILNQISSIYNSFKFNLSADSSCLEVGLDYGEGHETSVDFVWRNYCNKIPEINLNGFLGMKDRFQVIDLRFFWQYRETLFFWTKLILGTTTFLKLLKIIPGYFKH